MPDGMPGDATANGVASHMAAELLKNLVDLNRNMEQNRRIFSELLESIGELCGNFEVINRALEIVHEMSEDGKSKWSLKDFARAYIEASDEVFPTEDEAGDEDPRVGAEA